MEVTTQRARLWQPDSIHNPHIHAQHSQYYRQQQQQHTSHPHSYLCSSTTADNMDAHHHTPVPRGRQRRRSPMPLTAVPFPLQMTSASGGDENQHYSYYTTNKSSSLRADTPSGGSGTFRGRRRHRSPSILSSRSTSVASVASAASVSSSVRSSSSLAALSRQSSREPSAASAWRRVAMGRATTMGSSSTKAGTERAKAGRDSTNKRALRRRNRCPSRSVSVSSRVSDPTLAGGVAASVDAEMTGSVDFNDPASRVLLSFSYSGRRRRRQRTRSRPRTHRQHRTVVGKDGAGSGVVEEYEYLDDDNDTSTTPRAATPRADIQEGGGLE